jgi:2-polyprenyl-6-methoxyphenol hydroxylase-like FAD-dependent oxidoreductase
MRPCGGSCSHLTRGVLDAQLGHDAGARNALTPSASSLAPLNGDVWLEAFSRIGVVDEIIAAGQRTTGLQMYADRVSLGKFALDTVDSPYPFSVTLPQDETERILTARLAALGVAVEREQELVGFEQDASAVRAHLSSGEEIRSDWIAGTDGSHSTVRDVLGLRLEGSFKGESFLLGDVEADHDLDRSTMHTFFTTDAGPLMVFPMVGRRLRLIGPTRPCDSRRSPSADAGGSPGGRGSSHRRFSPGVSAVDHRL